MSAPSLPTVHPATVHLGAGTISAPGFLARFGYLGDPDEGRPAVAAALRRFQAFSGLPATGTLDTATETAMTRSRCALPDPDPLAFTALTAWDRTTLTYAFDNDSTDLGEGPQRDAVRRALATWTSVTPVAFREVAESASPDLRIGWRTIPDADYDLSGSTIAHSDYPPGSDYVTTMLPKPVHFDDTENTWAVGVSAGAFDVESVALHEIGHILGLAHSSTPGAVMQPTIADGATARVLADDDIEGVQGLYPQSVTMVARHSGLALDVIGADPSAGAGIQQFPVHGGANQVFQLVPVASRRYRILASHSGLVLTIAGASNRVGAKVTQRSWNGRLGQLFRLEPAGNGYHRIIADHSGLVLGIDGGKTDSGAALIQTGQADADSQRFRIGFVALTNRASGLVLDVPGRSVGSGVDVQQYPSNGGRHQRIRVEPLGDGTFRMVFRHSGKVLDVAFASTDPGAPVVQSDWHGGTNQRFRITSVGDGFARITAVHSSLTLDVQAGSRDAGARIVQDQWLGRLTQQWRL